MFERKRRECISKRGKERGMCKREKGIYVYVLLDVLAQIIK